MLTIDSDPVRLLTPDLPGIGGSIRERPGDFVVEERPLYEPEGEGEHVYLRLEYEGQTTKSIQQQLANLFDHPEYAVGFAGLKDRHARSIQTFSIHDHDLDPEEGARRVEEQLDLNVLNADRHRNKLRTGHLLGNHFEITIRDPDPVVPEIKSRVSELTSLLRDNWIPNYYGPQRTGDDGRSMRGGRAIYHGELTMDHRFTRRMYLSAYQAGLFNTWLANRIQTYCTGRMLDGDIAKKRDTGGLFEVEKPPEAQKRLESGEIVYTGPIFGSDTWRATGEAGRIEQTLFDSEELDKKRLSELGLDGSRRRGIIRPETLEADVSPDRVTVSFALPKGSFATVVLRELQKPG